MLDTDTPRNPAAPDPPTACHYQGGTYSAGAVLRMGRLEKVCTIVDGVPTWVRG
ncbi:MULTISPECIES: hypothetical protein [unclassified Acidovorax]|uniref:hypothetical protein n=1 Tax=unclassified Acidovorax TaxID=2684926 RepID=UPI001C47A4E5|nr:MULTISPECIES: hypothetical protein [unclassified Acidovorax]MBV7460467.1 hypothetical protein [Acidovorax sp. sif0632]MBV7465492.1 hypothetical protein [Acidovorax sp. sif0613]